MLFASAKEKQTEKRCTVASGVQHLHFCELFRSSQVVNTALISRFPGQNPEINLSQDDG